jgi:hypothetical protein
MTYLCRPSSLSFSNAMTERIKASSPESVGILAENLCTFKQLRMKLLMSLDFAVPGLDMFSRYEIFREFVAVNILFESSFCDR